MDLLPIVNKEATEDIVRTFLDIDFPRYVLKAGSSMVDVKSPSFSSLPPSTKAGNSVEDNMIEHIDAPKIVNAVIDAINRCPDIYKQILRLKFILQLTDEQVNARLPYGRAQYYRLKAISMLYFADAFENTEDLHIYEDSEDDT